MSTPDAFDRITTRIGDLDHPLYDEERQRDVWNEASAVGFQLLLWALLVAAVVSVWVGGADAVPYTLGMTLPMGLASIVAVSYAARRGVDLRAAGHRNRGRTAAVLVLVLALVVGVLRSTGVDAATLAGLVVGAGTVLVVSAVATWWIGRRRPAEED